MERGEVNALQGQVVYDFVDKGYHYGWENVNSILNRLSKTSYDDDFRNDYV